MAFFEQQFPPRISANMEGGPGFLVTETDTPSGFHFANLGSLYPLNQYTMDHPVRNRDDFEELRAFFMVVGGSADGFRFKDWTDFILNQQNSMLVMVSAGVYQIVRVYAFGSRTLNRPIQKPLAGVKTFRTRSGSTTEITGTDAGTPNTTNGRIAIANHVSGDTYKVEGQFDVPVVFTDPRARFRVLGGSRMLMEWPGIEVREIRVKP